MCSCVLCTMNVFTCVHESLMCSGQPDVFHIKDHLATKDILNSTLVGILDMFEYDDASGRKQRLLHYLWPDRSFDTFKDYLPHRGKLSINVSLYTSC